MIHTGAHEVPGRKYARFYGGVSPRGSAHLGRQNLARNCQNSLRTYVIALPRDVSLIADAIVAARARERADQNSYMPVRIAIDARSRVVAMFFFPPSAGYEVSCYGSLFFFFSFPFL